MIRRWLWALGFGIVGFASVLVWGGTINPKLCDIFVQLCVSRDGKCGAGDGCPDTIGATLSVIAFIFPLPSVLFAVLGYFFSKNFCLGRMILLCVMTIAAHWVIMFTLEMIFDF